MKLYVGNISFTITEADLHQIFEQFGSVTELKVITDRETGQPRGFDERISRLSAGESAGLTRDDILDNITLCWLTNTAISSACLYWESKFAFFSVKGVSIPVAVSVFPDELYPTPRSWAERAYGKLIHYNKLDKGGHFGAWEQPALFAARGVQEAALTKKNIYQHVTSTVTYRKK